MNDMTQQEDDYLIFQSVNSTPQCGKERQDPDNEKHPIPGEFDSLYDELLHRCDPTVFLKPYDERKASIANEIYSQALSNKEDINVLKNLRTKAIHDLGVKFSTVALYDRLIGICNPKLYTGEDYDTSKFEKANRLFAKIKQNADNIEILECIETESSDLEEVIIQRTKQAQEQKIAEAIKRRKENELHILEQQKKDYSFVIEMLVTITMVTIFIVIFSAYDHASTVEGALVYIAIFFAIVAIGIIYSSYTIKDVRKRINDFKQQNNIEE